MIPSVRATYNHQFTHRQYQEFLSGIAEEAGEAPAFKVAETPVFIPAQLTARIQQACDEIVAVILRPDFKHLTSDAIPHELKVPHENDHPHFMVIDFAVCRDEQGDLTPKLIELQGFPSLYAFQELMARQFRTHFNIPDTLNNFFNGLDADSYFDLLKEVIVGPHEPREVVLLEVKPDEQKTRIDFYYTEEKLGIKPVCITDLIQEGKKLYYELDGQRIQIKRIYNRVIFDDLHRQQESLGKHVHLFQELDVEWITHPNWFYRISKYILPFIHSEYAPKSWFLHELPVIPADLENYVLKPLFSFAGKGVLIDVTQADIDKISDPENWILQHKVQYAPAVETPEGPAYCEIRMMYVWPDSSPAPLLVHNLARISKSKLIGVSQGKPQNWTGGSCAFFEQPS
jgi:glutathionylspermidine synthase